MADMLQCQYTSVFSLPKEDYSYLDSNHDTDNFINDVQFTEEDFINEIDTLSINSAAGPDGIPVIFLKQCKHSISKPMNIFWRNCLDHGITPKTLKTSYITPIFKSGDQGAPENYRPVALTSQMTKIFEKVIRRKLLTFMEDNDLFNPSQHGFRPGRSCLSQLLEHTERLLSYIENNENVDVVYLDFSKAFDRVDHTILIHKLKKYGISGKILKWIISFLTGRTQRVMVNTFLSKESEVLSGVPQGSVLGPLLFLIMIADIDESIRHSFLSSFADDTRIMKGITCITDAFKLQNDLNTIYKWTETNNAQLNGKKFEHLVYGKHNDQKTNSIYLTSTGSKITTKSTVKDLGVVLSSDLSYEYHIDNIIKKVNGICAWISRVFKSKNPCVLLTLWKVLVLPHLDYCSQLWAPSKKSSIQRLEYLQKAFFKKLKSVDNLNYWEQLKKLKTYSLERRRERYRILYTWYILEGFVPNFNYAKKKGGIHSYHNERQGRKCVLKEVNLLNRNIWKGSLSEEGPKLFNCLPKALRNLHGCSKEFFKRQLDRFLATVPDEPQLPSYLPFRRSDSNSIQDMSKYSIGLFKLDE